MLNESSTTLIEELVDENCPVEELVRFSTNRRNLIREAVATNPSTPAELINKMVPDSNIMVCQALVLSGKVTPENLIVLANHDLNDEYRQQDLRGVIATQPGAPSDIIEWVIEKGSHSAQSIVLCSPDVPAYLLRALWVKAADYMKADAINRRYDTLPLDLLLASFYSSPSPKNNTVDPRKFLLGKMQQDKEFARKFLLYALKSVGMEENFSELPFDWLVEIAKNESIDIFPKEKEVVANF